MKKFLKKYWWAVLLGILLIGGILWYYYLRPAWTGVPCMKDWKSPKWKAFKAHFYELHKIKEPKGGGDDQKAAEDDKSFLEDRSKELGKALVKEGEEAEEDSGESTGDTVKEANDWVRWFRATLEEPWYERDKVEKNGLCKMAGRSNWRQRWEDVRAEKGLNINGGKLKGEWSYEGPITCLQGFSRPRYEWVRDAWLDLFVGISLKEGRFDTADKAYKEGKWLWNTAGDKEWAQSFGSDTITIDEICKELNGNRSFFPDLISRSDLDNISPGYATKHSEIPLPGSMGGLPIGSYSIRHGAPESFTKEKFGYPKDQSDSGGFGGDTGDDAGQAPGQIQT